MMETVDTISECSVYECWIVYVHVVMCVVCCARVCNMVLSGLKLV